MATREMHQNLRGGTGVVTTYTTKIFGLTFVRIYLGSRATIGSHVHTEDREIYFTFDRNVRFCQNPKWKFCNFCKKGSAHSAENLSWSVACIRAIKF